MQHAAAAHLNMSNDAKILESNEVKKAQKTVYYIPNFISKEEEQYLSHQVYNAPKPKWTQLSNRRLQNWGGLPHPKGMVAEKLPKWLDIYSHKIADLGVFGELVPNHVLVNEYQPGQGIMPHEDGPLFHPVVTTISLGSHTLLDFYQHRRHAAAAEGEQGNQLPQGSEDQALGDVVQQPFMSLLLERRSLLVLKDDMYVSLLHGIAERSEDVLTETVANLDRSEGRALGDTLARSCRISLTIRHVPKTLKVSVFGRR